MHCDLHRSLPFKLGKKPKSCLWHSTSKPLGHLRDSHRTSEMMYHQYYEQHEQHEQDEQHEQHGHHQEF